MRAILAMGVLLLLVPAAAAAPPDVAVTMDRVAAPDVETFHLEPGCIGGAFEVDAARQAVRFHEEETLPGLPLGQFQAGCGTASVRLEVPAGAEEARVRFQADRVVESAVPLQARFLQEVWLLGPDGTLLASHKVFPDDAPPQALQWVEVVFPLPEADEVAVAWRFEDLGTTAASYAATVQAPQVVFAGIPAAALVSTERARDGALRTTTVEVRIDVPEPEATQVRLVFDAPLAFLHVAGPGGVFDATATAGAPLDRVLLHEEDGRRTVVVPAAVLAQLGAGEHVVRLESVVRLETTPVLQALAAVLLLVPLPFAAIAFLQVRAFEREAFGGFARSARRLRHAVLLVLLYHVVVVVSALVGGRLDLMAVRPMPLEGVLLYLQVAAAVVAFTGLWLVARELFRLTRPRAAHG